MMNARHLLHIPATGLMHIATTLLVHTHVHVTLVMKGMEYLPVMVGLVSIIYCGNVQYVIFCRFLIIGCVFIIIKIISFPMNGVYVVKNTLTKKKINKNCEKSLVENSPCVKI